MRPDRTAFRPTISNSDLKKAFPQVARHSPCIGICKLDATTGYCLGCGRTGAEIGDWMAMSEMQRDAVWDTLPERLAKLSVGVRLMPWTFEELVDWARDSIVGRQGTWVVGPPGAVAEFPTNGDTPIDVRVEEGVITANRSDARFRLTINEKVRAFAFAHGGPIVLGLPRGRAVIPSGSALRSLGLDAEAIEDDNRDAALFDIGIGRQYSRFSVRTKDARLISALARHEGRHWSELMPTMLNQFIETSPHRVVQSAAARIEIFAKIAGPGQTLPSGAHTQFLPEFLKSGEEIAAGITPPGYAAPVAIFYPRKI